MNSLSRLLFVLLFCVDNTEGSLERLSHRNQVLLQERINSVSLISPRKEFALFERNAKKEYLSNIQVKEHLARNAVEISWLLGHSDLFVQTPNTTFVIIASIPADAETERKKLTDQDRNFLEGFSAIFCKHNNICFERVLCGEKSTSLILIKNDSVVRVRTRTVFVLNDEELVWSEIKK